MNHCVCCGSPIPDDQGSRTCSMCYGDPDHGKDGYYQDWLERQYEEEQFRRWKEEQESKELQG